MIIRKRYKFLGYSFFILLIIVSFIMSYSLYSRMTHQQTASADKLIDRSMQNYEFLAEDPVNIMTAFSKDFYAKHENFHDFDQTKFIRQDKREVCLKCHLPLPHNENKRYRAFLNMHCNYLSCNSCHLDQKGIQFQWFDVLENTNIRHSQHSEKIMRYQIVPSVNGKSQYISQDNEIAKSISEITPFSPPADIIEYMDEFMEDVKLQMYVCTDCHSEAGVIDYKKLGYIPEEAQKLQTLSIPAVYEEYENFQLPIVK